MSSLEDLIRREIKAGNLLHLTFSPAKGGFQANYKHVDSKGGYDIAISHDPIEALKAALNKAPAPAKAKRAARSEDLDDLLG